MKWYLIVLAIGVMVAASAFAMTGPIAFLFGITGGTMVGYGVMSVIAEVFL